MKTKLSLLLALTLGAFGQVAPSGIPADVTDTAQISDHYKVTADQPVLTDTTLMWGVDPATGVLGVVDGKELGKSAQELFDELAGDPAGQAALCNAIITAGCDLTSLIDFSALSPEQLADLISVLPPETDVSAVSATLDVNGDLIVTVTEDGVDVPSTPLELPESLYKGELADVASLPATADAGTMYAVGDCIYVYSETASSAGWVENCDGEENTDSNVTAVATTLDGNGDLVVTVTEDGIPVSSPPLELPDPCDTPILTATDITDTANTYVRLCPEGKINIDELATFFGSVATPVVCNSAVLNRNLMPITIGDNTVSYTGNSGASAPFTSCGATTDGNGWWIWNNTSTFVLNNPSDGYIDITISAAGANSIFEITSVGTITSVDFQGTPSDCSMSVDNSGANPLLVHNPANGGANNTDGGVFRVMFEDLEEISIRDTTGSSFGAFFNFEMQLCTGGGS